MGKFNETKIREKEEFARADIIDAKRVSQDFDLKKNCEIS